MRDDDALRDLALLFARTALGASMAAHGMQKLAGWFGGPGPEGTEQFMKALGWEPAPLYGRIASVNEVVAGALVAAGALGPVGPAMMIASMVSAVGSVHWKNGFWNANQGYELNTLYTIAALMLVVNDPGRLSFDAAVGLRHKWRTTVDLVVVAGGVAGSLYALSRRQPPQQPEQTS